MNVQLLTQIYKHHTLLDAIPSPGRAFNPSGHLQGVSVGPSPGERDGQSFRSAGLTSAQSIESWHGEGGDACRANAEASGGEAWLCLECELEIQGLSEQAWATDTGPSVGGLGVDHSPSHCLRKSLEQRYGSAKCSSSTCEPPTSSLARRNSSFFIFFCFTLVYIGSIYF